MNLLDLFFKGGMAMYPILGCAIIVVIVALERMFVFGKGRIDFRQFMMQVRSIVQNGDVDALLSFSSKDASVARIVHRGMTRYNLGAEKVYQLVVKAAKEEGYRLKKGLPVLAGISGIAPMLGFLGSAMGMVVVLQNIERVTGIVNSSELAGGIAGAFVSTIFGLLVGAVSYTLFSSFSARVARLVYEMDMTASELLELLQQRSVQQGLLKVQEEPTPQVRTPRPRPTLVFEDDAYFRKKG